MPKDWEGFEIIGAGHDYAAVETFLDWYPTEIKRRYSEGAQSGLTADQFRDRLAAAGRAMTLCLRRTNQLVWECQPR
ncbi:hypothetical protein K9N68_39910 (plasmid) [Kovacikia minuta CCNUW1]|uniref:hypothetical protein n=1 Tax=Kovacikia minuta TaxID=2931930 RepID=UPI001CC9E761|nr:hypothetical protein [Kovacikia minuta]UBF30764.1 hypothetical protein K9N68_39910 [Kovacikia minuta CCNUW1]